MLRHPKLLIEHYQTLVVQLHPPALLARSSPNVDYNAGSVWTKRDSFYLTKADSTVNVILRGGEGLLDISSLCLAIIWRLNGLKAASNTQKDKPLQKYPLCVSRRLHLRVPDNMLVSPLVGTRLHACSRQEAHLLTTNNLQMVSKFSLVLGQISTTEVLFKYWQRLLFDT